MKVLKREWTRVSRTEQFTITPIGDIHLGSRACDENLLKSVINRVKNDSRAYWIGMGDYCDFINRKDPRFSADVMSDWLLTRGGLTDIAKTQKDYFLDLFSPIANKCLGMLQGNHEAAITKHYERDIYSELVTEVKARGGFDAEIPLALGYYGWLILKFSMMKNGDAAEVYKFNLHHGFVGGKLAGAKALEMQRWLWSHDADVVVFGHSHNTAIQPEAVESVDRNGNLAVTIRRGCYGGTFLKTVEKDTTTYSEMKGYYPIPMGGVEIQMRPCAADRNEAIRIST